VVGGLIGVLLGVGAVAIGQFSPVKPRINSLVDSAGGGCLSRSWDIFFSSRAAISTDYRLTFRLKE